MMLLLIDCIVQPLYDNEQCIVNGVERCRCDLMALTYQVPQLSKTTQNLGIVSVMAAIRTECLMNTR
jgi:hypothetical protein